MPLLSRGVAGLALRESMAERSRARGLSSTLAVVHFTVAEAADLVWTPTVIVALGGAVATAVVAISGLVVTVVLANRDSRREARRERYKELVELYGRLGRAMVGVTLIIRASAGPDAATPEEADARIAELEARFPETREQGFAVAELSLLGAAAPVVAAYEAWWTYLQKAFGGAPGELGVAPEELVPRLEALVEEFQRIAGQDARAALRKS